MKKALTISMLVFIAAPAAAQKKSSPTTKCADLERENAELRAELEKLRGAAPTETATQDGPGTADRSADVPAAGDVGAAGFGKLRWGASLAELKRAYSDVKPTGRIWAREGEVGGIEALTAFHLVNDKLVAVVIVFQEEYQNKTKYLYEHDRIRELLEKKYGRPKNSSRDIWLGDNLYRDTPGEWGMAVATGRLSRWSTWELPETEIELGTKGENFRITNKIVYRSVKLKAELEQKQEAQSLDGL